MLSLKKASRVIKLTEMAAELTRRWADLKFKQKVAAYREQCFLAATGLLAKFREEYHLTESSSNRAFAAGLLILRNISIIVVIFGIVLLCFIWIGLHYKIQAERDLEIDNAIRQTANFARTFEEHTLRTLKSADQEVLFLKYQYEREGRIDISRYAGAGKFAGQPFLELSVIDENGNLAVSSQASAVSANFSDCDYFAAHRDTDDGNVFISKPVLDGTSGTCAILMSRRVNKPAGTFGGVAVVSLDPLYFDAFYQQIDLGRNSSINLVGRDGIIRARQSGHNVAAGQDIRQGILMEKLSLSNPGYYISKSNIDGVTRICSYRALTEYPLVVAVGVDQAEVLQNLDQRIKAYVTVAGLVSIVIICFIGILLRNIRKQKQTEEKLKQSYDDLEDKVRLRTHELVAANQELFAMNEELVLVNKEFEAVNRELEKEVSERNLVEEELRQKNEKIQRMAYTDVLTGLPNRAHLLERLDAEMEKAGRGEATGVVMFVDLDDLKTVNDVFGHTCGDGLIITAGTRIAEETGDGAFVARIGGDEFIAILSVHTGKTSIDDIAARLISALAREYEVFGNRFKISASIGIAAYPEDGGTTEDIIKNADNAMYAAKQSGKNCWRHYETAMHAAVYEKMLLTNSLRQAIEREEFLLHYQPQVAVQGGGIVGFEALLRWNSKEHGVIPPARFIPLAEENGLVQSIGQWVLRQACQFARRLTDGGWQEAYVGVNISAKQLTADDFITIVREALEEAGIEPCQLELEITESLLMVSLEDATRKLAELQAMGVRLSLDDFGTGYSSLTYLRHLPVKTLKIDKSFIDMIETDVFSSKIIGSIINMAHTLRINVVAEGVETKQQFTYLADNGCDCIQGYIFSKPVPEEEAIRLLGQSWK